MPRYEYACHTCETVSEHRRHVDHRDDPIACEVCGEPMQRFISGMKVIGATPSRPIDMTKQLGRVFETTSEYEKYVAESGGREISKSDLRGTIDQIKDSKERKAQAQGYKSWRHRTSEIKKRAAMEAPKS